MLSRRQFLRGDFKSRRHPQRPPWALVEERFIEQCTRCGACDPVCPTHILVVIRGFPEVDFKLGECTFCAACLDACKAGALQRSSDTGSRTPWSITAHVGESCLPQRDVECRICGEYCAANAIRFSPRLGGPPVPEVRGELCTGCGACVAPCPAAAISIR
jgi:ferredoxin-type protein NapF